MYKANHRTAVKSEVAQQCSDWRAYLGIEVIDFFNRRFDVALVDQVPNFYPLIDWIHVDSRA